MTMMKVLKQPDAVGLICASATAAIGVVYLTAAGAPARHVLINVAAFAVGLAAYATVVLPRWRLGRAGELALPGLGLALLAVAWLGTPVEGAARWIALGPLNLQLSLILVPAMIVVFARRPSLAGTAGIGLAALALALQPDRAMAGVLSLSLLVLAAARPERAVVAACGAALASFAAALVQPDNLPAVPFVDQIFYSSFQIHAALGVALIAGAGLLCLPGLVAGTREAAACSRLFGRG
jgi:cell division protein FtsW (lipid II flippase)